MRFELFSSAKMAGRYALASSFHTLFDAGLICAHFKIATQQCFKLMFTEPIVPFALWPRGRIAHGIYSFTDVVEQEDDREPHAILPRQVYTVYVVGPWILRDSRIDVTHKHHRLLYPGSDRDLGTVHFDADEVEHLMPDLVKVTTRFLRFQHPLRAAYEMDVNRFYSTLCLLTDFALHKVWTTIRVHFIPSEKLQIVPFRLRTAIRNAGMPTCIPTVRQDIARYDQAGQLLRQFLSDPKASLVGLLERFAGHPGDPLQSGDENDENELPDLEGSLLEEAEYARLQTLMEPMPELELELERLQEL